MDPDGGDYAKSKYLKWHRLGSVTLVGALFAWYATRFGVAISIRSFAVFVIPLTLIWFSDDLAGWGSRDSGTWFSRIHGDTYVRICAWLILLLLAALRNMSMVA